MVNIDLIFHDAITEKIRYFFSPACVQSSLIDEEILSVIFACRAVNDLPAFERVYDWVKENRPDIIQMISGGVVIADASLGGSVLDIAFKLRKMNNAERAFTLLSALDGNNEDAINAVIDTVDSRTQLKLFEFLVRMFKYKIKNYNLLKINAIALTDFVNSIELIEGHMSHRKFQSKLLKRIKFDAFQYQNNFKKARATLEEIRGRDFAFRCLQLDFREACALGEFKKAQRTGISMIKSVMENPWLRRDAGQLTRFDTQACLTALRATYETLNIKNIEPFLISGTLLGMTRDGKIFDHDKDFDLGVIGWEKLYDVFEILYKSREYNVDIRYLKGNATYMLSARHKKTGIAFDIFFLHDEKDNFDYGINFSLGFMVKFQFSKFSLTEKKFGDDLFRVPTDTASFLNEKYGSGWVQKDQTYDVVLRSPALTGRGSDLYKTLALDRLFGSIVNQNTALTATNVKFLRSIAGSTNDIFTKFVASYPL